MAPHPAPAEDIDRALLHLALTGDNARKAAGELGINERTLRSWRQKHVDRYQELRATHVQQIERALVDDYRENARLSQELHRKATLHALQDLEDGNIKDAARVAREASIAAGIATDKMLVVDGRPTHIQETRDLDTILGSLAKRYGFDTIPGTAEDITDTALTSDACQANTREAGFELPAGEST